MQNIIIDAVEESGSSQTIHGHLIRGRILAIFLKCNREILKKKKKKKKKFKQVML